MKIEVTAYHLDAAASRYYGRLTLQKSSLTENGDRVSAVSVHTPPAVDSEMERVYYATVKKMQ